MRTLFVILGAVVMIAGTHARAQDWKPCEGPLKTRWAKDVSPGNALPEYPRMQMVRKDWLSLNGVWDLKLADGTETKILVPFPVESALSGVMKHSDRLTYRRTFEVPKAWNRKRVLLHFGAVDWEAKVSVNGKDLGVHRGGYDGFSFDITDALKPSGPQELRVEVFDPTDAGQQPHGKQVLKPGGIMYTPSSGIWQTVWLEPVPKAHIETLRIVPDVDASCVYVTVVGEGSAEVVALEGTREVGRGKGPAGTAIKVPVRNARLWSPDSPHLYDLRVKCGRDEVGSYFGMRKIAIAKDETGVNRLMLNGKFIFQVGPLDQGFWPDGIYTAPTDEALKFDIEITKKLGMNCTRKHVKVEPDRWYYWCDKLGLLVWQDMPAGSNGNEEAKKQFEVELKRMVEGRWSHPSIIMWVVFNEGWGQYDTERLTSWVKQMDPSRLVNNASGWTDRKCGDVIDMHNYPGPGSPKPEATRAAVLGEFGGLGLGVDGHTWAPQHWGYRGMSSQEELTRSYVKLLSKAWGLKASDGLCACIYTQITDVETECNGLLTYDRQVVKVNLERAGEANRGRGPPPPEVKVVVPTSQRSGVGWRYVVQKPADDWFQPGFDDSAWKEGPGGFGTEGTPGGVVRTEWKTADIWLRRSFDWPADKVENPRLLVHHDEDVEVYINGTLAGKAEGFTTDYEELALTPEGRAALKPGQNGFAVHCHQTQGGQYIDVGIIDVIEKPAQAGEGGSAPLSLRLRRLVEIEPGSDQWRPVEVVTNWDARGTAVVICDMWDKHWCKSATARVAEMAPRMNQVITELRRRGVLIMHCPSETMDVYRDSPGRKLTQSAPKVDLQAIMLQNLARQPKNVPALPVDDSDGGCDDVPRCQEGKWPPFPWSHEITSLRIEDSDAITDNDEAFCLMHQRGITNVIVMGVHENMCVLGRPFSIRQMVKLGQNVVLMRDLTDSLYNPRRRPWVDHFTGTDLICWHIEEYWCPSITSDQIIGGQPFRFAADIQPPRVFRNPVKLPSHDTH